MGKTQRTYVAIPIQHCDGVGKCDKIFKGDINPEKTDLTNDQIYGAQEDIYDNVSLATNSRDRCGVGIGKRSFLTPRCDNLGIGTRCQASPQYPQDCVQPFTCKIEGITNPKQKPFFNNIRQGSLKGFGDQTNNNEKCSGYDIEHHRQDCTYTCSVATQSICPKFHNIKAEVWGAFDRPYIYFNTTTLNPDEEQEIDFHKQYHMTHNINGLKPAWGKAPGGKDEKWINQRVENNTLQLCAYNVPIEPIKDDATFKDYFDLTMGIPCPEKFSSYSVPGSDPIDEKLRSKVNSYQGCQPNINTYTKNLANAQNDLSDKNNRIGDMLVDYCMKPKRCPGGCFGGADLFGTNRLETNYCPQFKCVNTDRGVRGRCNALYRPHDFWGPKACATLNRDGGPDKDIPSREMNPAALQQLNERWKNAIGNYCDKEREGNQLAIGPYCNCHSSINKNSDPEKEGKFYTQFRNATSGMNEQETNVRAVGYEYCVFDFCKEQTGTSSLIPPYEYYTFNVAGDKNKCKELNINCQMIASVVDKDDSVSKEFINSMDNDECGIGTYMKLLDRNKVLCHDSKCTYLEWGKDDPPDAEIYHNMNDCSNNCGKRFTCEGDICKESRDGQYPMYQRCECSKRFKCDSDTGECIFDGTGRSKFTSINECNRECYKPPPKDKQSTSEKFESFLIGDGSNTKIKLYIGLVIISLLVFILLYLMSSLFTGEKNTVNEQYKLFDV